MRKIYRKQFYKWSNPIQAQLREYNLGAWAGMYQSLENNLDTFVMLDKGEVIGWAIVTCSDWAMFYVRPEYRREGVGKRLATRISRHHTNPRVDGWSDEAANFFSSVGLTRNQEYLV